MSTELRTQSPQFPASSKYHHPYFTPAEVDYLSEKQRGKLSITQEEKVRQNACGFLEAVGARIGFPRKTIATAQNLYHRFHLFFPRKDFSYYDVCLAALFVSTKMHDTLKKPRELLAVSYTIRRPELAAKSKNPSGEVDLEMMDPATVEHDRQRLLTVERLILETICFNFTSKMPFPYVIKIGRALAATKKLTKLAWRLAIDCHRTLVPLKYPPHVVALGSIYVASLLSSFEQPMSPQRSEHNSSHEIAATLSKNGDWEANFQARVEDLEEIAHVIIDLLLQVAQNPSANTSPSTPSSPSPHPSPRNQPFPANQSQFVPVPYKADQLIRLKIIMRESEHSPRPRKPLGNTDPSALYGGDDAALLGRNEGTVRFLFGPPGIDPSVDPEIMNQYLTERKHRRTPISSSGDTTSPWSPGNETPIALARTNESMYSRVPHRRGCRAGRKVQATRWEATSFRDSPPQYLSTATATASSVPPSRLGNAVARPPRPISTTNLQIQSDGHANWDSSSSTSWIQQNKKHDMPSPAWE